MNDWLIRGILALDNQNVVWVRRSVFETAGLDFST